MTGINHIAGGIAFTGIFASFSDINIFQSPADLAVTLFFSLLPDIDHTKSPLGKVFFPLARYLDRHFGHRTLTHSLLCWIGVTLLFRLLFFVFFTHTQPKTVHELTSNACLAYLSHLIFDMCTKSGIPFFYPFSAARCVIPGNPAMRLPAGNAKVETLIFCVFNSLTLTCYPLMKQGFWMSYNNAFKTFAHLHNEYRRSPSGLEVTFQTQHESISKGLVVAAEDHQAVVFLSGTAEGFKEISQETTELIAFRHPAQTLLREKVAFADISEDSLRSLLRLPLLQLSLHSSHPVHYLDKGEVKINKSLRLQYTDSFSFSVEMPDSSQLLHQIYKQEMLIQEEKVKQQQSLDSLYKVKEHIRQLEKIYPYLTDYEKGKATAKLKRLHEWLEKFHLHAPQIESFEKELSFLKSRLEPHPVFNGYVVLLKIQE
jgi:inner membrane protein